MNYDTMIRTMTAKKQRQEAALAETVEHIAALERLQQQQRELERPTEPRLPLGTPDKSSKAK